MTVRIKTLPILLLLLTLAVGLRAWGLDRDSPAVDILSYEATWIDEGTLALLALAEIRGYDSVSALDTFPAASNMSHRRAVMIPTDSVGALPGAARKYDVRHMLLEFDCPKPPNDLFPIPWLPRVADVRDALDRPITLYEAVQ